MKKTEGLFIRACSDRTRGNHFKLKEHRFRLCIRKKFFIMGGLDTETGFPERLLMPQPWLGF